VLATGASEQEVDAALVESGGDAKVALVSLLAGIDTSTARERLDGAGGSVRLAVGDRR
jgi:N-acetylmuramic acid 6-phosphate etherase